MSPLLLSLALAAATAVIGVGPSPPPAAPGTYKAVEEAGPVPLILPAVVPDPSEAGSRLRPREVLGAQGPDLCVVVFVTTTCPIANASMPAIGRLGRTVREAGGELLLVHPDPLATAETVEKHRRDRGIEPESLLDPAQRLVARLGATVVPEVFVLTRDDRQRWKTRYRGPVDDLYAGVGRRRRAATTAFAAEAVEKLRAGKTIDVPIRTAHGCAIERMSK